MLRSYLVFGHYLGFIWWYAAVVHAYLITSDPTSLSNQTFDYVIVGGGTAGPYFVNLWLFLRNWAAALILHHFKINQRLDGSE